MTTDPETLSEDISKKAFRREVRRARRKGGNATGHESDYWQGYQRGLRRRYHGERFGTDEDHDQMLALREATSESRQQRGQGYADALQWDGTPAAVQPSHGGAREGAGRQPTYDKPMQKKTLSAPAQHFEHLRKLGEGSMSKGLRELVEASMDFSGDGE